MTYLLVGLFLETRNTLMACHASSSGLVWLAGLQKSGSMRGHFLAITQLLQVF
jgi:hypothetical protein